MGILALPWSRQVVGKSDLVILLVSATLLGVGIIRWQNNLSPVPALATQGISPGAQTNPAPQVPGAVPTAAQSTINDNSRSLTGSAAGSGTQIATGTLENSVVGNVAATTSTQNSPAGESQSSNQTPTVAATSGTQSESLYGTYVVRPGDSLSQIAINYGTTVDTLRSINNISGSLINVNQEILYPLPAN